MSQVRMVALQTLVGKSTESDKDTVLKLVRLKGVGASCGQECPECPRQGHRPERSGLSSPSPLKASIKHGWPQTSLGLGKLRPGEVGSE